MRTLGITAALPASSVGRQTRSPSLGEDVAFGVPSGVADEHVANVAQPTAMAFTRDGRILIAKSPWTKPGNGGGGGYDRSVRRRAAIAAAVVGVLSIAIVLLVVRSSRQRAASPAEHGERTTARTVVGNSRVGATTASRNVAGIVYLDDAPSAGARVRLVDLRGSFEASRPTDDRGHFDFGAVPVSAYRVIAEVPRATGAAIDVDLRDQLVDGEKLRLIAHACDASLHGDVRDVSGGIVGRARLFVSPDFSGEGPGTDAGDDGAYELCVPFGDSGVIVRADGYADTLAFVSASGRVRRDFELVPEAVVAGRAVRASDGAPVSGAQLTLEPDGFSPMQPMPRLRAVSGADGEFRFRGVPPGQYALSATADHLGSAEPVHVDASVGIPAEGIECKLVPTLSIIGHVVEKGSRKPVPGRMLWLSGPSPDNMPMTTSRSDGYFAFEHLAPGEYRIHHTRGVPSQASVQLKLDNADVVDLMIEVDPLASIAGRVTRAGKPVDGASVQAEITERDDSPPGAQGRAYATTDADGSFVLRELGAGSYRVYAESKRVGAFTRGPVVTVRDAEQKSGVEVEMNLAGSIAGTVVDQTGAPVAGAHVRFSLIQGRDFGEATTTDDGTFKAVALSGGGEYMFEVRPTTTSTQKLRPAGGTRFAPITVRDGDSHVTGVQIKVHFERLSIGGRVVTSEGEGVPDVTVTADRENGRRVIGAALATTDASGAFTIRDLTAGPYTVRVRSTTGSASVDGVTAGAKNVELRLPALGAIEGTLEGFATAPSIVVFSSQYSFRHRAASSTAFSITRIPVGTYDVLARSDNGFARATATVKGKSVAKVTLRNAGVGTIEGRVLDEATRQPIVDLMCASDSSVARTDTSGAFRLEGVAPGNVDVFCYGYSVQADARTVVEAGKPSHIEITARKRSRATRGRGYAGLELEIQDSDVAVKSVMTGGPAERAGIKRGDLIREVGDFELDLMQGLQWVLNTIEAHGPGQIVKLTLERDGKERTVELKLEQAP